MKKLLYVFVILILVTVIGIGYTRLFINEPFGVRDVVLYEQQADGTTKRVYCGGYNDPDISVKTHLDNPIQRLLAVKTIFTREDLNRNKHMYKSYTLFGIPLSMVEVDCKTGTIQTVSGL